VNLRPKPALTQREARSRVGLSLTARAAEAALMILSYSRPNLGDVCDLDPSKGLTANPCASTATMLIARLTVDHLIWLKQLSGAPLVALLPSLRPSAFALLLGRASVAVSRRGLARGLRVELELALKLINLLAQLGDDLNKGLIRFYSALRPCLIGLRQVRYAHCSELEATLVSGQED